jgi:hypothetical protein
VRRRAGPKRMADNATNLRSARFTANATHSVQ